jgi:hypothetical protein
MNCRLRRIVPLLAMALCLAPHLIVTGGAAEGDTKKSNVVKTGSAKSGHAAESGDISEARKSYWRLEDLYRKWNEGLFGSRNYRRRELEAFLSGIIRKEIETDYDCMVDASTGASDGSVRCSVGWLTLRGPLDEDSLKETAGGAQGRSGGRPNLLRSWWRSGVLVSVRGRVRRFGIDTLHRDGGVTLYLDAIAVRSNNGNTAKKKN